MPASDMIIVLKDKSEWTSAKTFDELSEKMANELEAVPGVSYGFQYSTNAFNELMSSSRQDVFVKYLEKIWILWLYADKMSRAMKTVEGTTDLYVETVTGI
jgi:cobalt-zinc-cadmium resistance protein CzcA